MRAASSADTISACVSRIGAAGELDELCDDKDDAEDDAEEDDMEEDDDEADEKEEVLYEADEKAEAEDRRQNPPCASSGRSSGTSECANRASDRLRDDRAAALRCTVECCNIKGKW